MLWMRHPPVGRSNKSMFIHVSPMKKSQCFTISRCLLLVDGLSWNQIRSDTLLPGFSRASRHLGPDILDCFNKIQCIHCFLVFHFSQMITLPVEVSQQVYRPWGSWGVCCTVLHLNLWNLWTSEDEVNRIVCCSSSQVVERPFIGRLAAPRRANVTTWRRRSINPVNPQRSRWITMDLA
jgi:hypothetical protein